MEKKMPDGFQKGAIYYAPFTSFNIRLLLRFAHCS